MVCFELTLCLAGAPGSVFGKGTTSPCIPVWLVGARCCPGHCQSATGAVSRRDPSASWAAVCLAI